MDGVSHNPINLLVQVLDAIEDFAVLADSTGRIIVFNSACERATSYRRDAVCGHNLLGASLPEALFGEIGRGFVNSFTAEVPEARENSPKMKLGGIA